MARVQYYSYTVFLKGAKFSDGSTWSHSSRAPDAETAKLTAALFWQQHRTSMGKKPRTLVSLLSKMVARRRGKE